MNLISLYFLIGIAFVFWMEWNWKQHVKTVLLEQNIKIKKKFGWRNRVFHTVCWPFGIVMIVWSIINNLWKR